MKNVIKLESVGIFIGLLYTYHLQFPYEWGFFLMWFFAPDLSFLAYVISKKSAGICYNIVHHQGLIAVFMGGSVMFGSIYAYQIGFIFLAHSVFDRVMGYGLKYLDHFDHTHLGWIGKSKHLNQTNN
ncbi:MAG: hypothetical protein RLZZ531_1208 [Bacteroidota bacterium]|jgi:hypothetical protein